MMLEPGGEIASQFMHALPGESLHERAKRKLIELAAPVLDPAQAGFRFPAVGDADLRNQYRIITKRREDDLINRIVLSGNPLAKVSDSESPVEDRRISGMFGAQQSSAICQI